MRTTPQEDESFGVLPADVFNQALRNAIHRQNEMTLDADDPALPRDLGDAMNVTTGLRSVNFLEGA